MMTVLHQQTVDRRVAFIGNHHHHDHHWCTGVQKHASSSSTSQSDQRYAWSQYVEYDADGSWVWNKPDSNRFTLQEQQNQLGAIRADETCESVETSTTTRAKTSYDLASPREWLEYQESCHSQGKGGAYTVIRCDLLTKNEEHDGNNSYWRIWELDFHLQRLQQSYLELTNQTNIDGELLKRAVNQSNETLHALLDVAEEVLQPTNMQVSEKDTSLFCVCMLTLLWQEEHAQLSVRGHVFSTGVFSSSASALDPNPTPITVALAIGVNQPNRYENHPRAKLSSWCRTRRVLEERFKEKGVDEVLLVLDQPEYENHDAESCPPPIHVLLEGLTSNLFVLDHNGTLRTSPNGVLEGCARYLVIKHAQRLGWNVDLSPITLESRDTWKEVFCTSSIRLIVPVERLVQASDDGDDLVQVWKTSSESNRWKELYASIIQAV